MTIECCYNCKNYTEECLKQNYDKCNKYEGVIKMLNKEQLISEMKELKQEILEDLMKLNAKHDALVEFIANLSYLIDEAEGKNDGTD